MCRCPFPGINVLLFEGKNESRCFSSDPRRMARRNETGGGGKKKKKGEELLTNSDYAPLLRVYM